MWSLKKIRRWLDDRKKEAEKLAQEEKLKLKEKLHKIKLELQMELQATQTSQHPLHTNMSSNIWAKLPKLVTMKFDGTFVDWPQFWGQFTETVDKTSVVSIMKFSYQQELLNFKVKWTIEALPLTSEGCNRGNRPRSWKHTPKKFWTSPPYQTRIQRKSANRVRNLHIVCRLCGC